MLILCISSHFLPVFAFGCIYVEYHPSNRVCKTNVLLELFRTVWITSLWETAWNSVNPTIYCCKWFWHASRNFIDTHYIREYFVLQRFDITSPSWFCLCKRWCNRILLLGFCLSFLSVFHTSVWNLWNSLREEPWSRKCSVCSAVWILSVKFTKLT